MYYAWAVVLTTLIALSSITSKQAKATQAVEDQVKHLLNYLHTYKDATLRYIASNMVLNIHLDALYLSEPKAQSCLGGTFFLGSLLQDEKPIQLNGPILTVASICKFVIGSAAEAELRPLFYSKEGTILQLSLEELGHPQPATPVHSNNSTAVSIANGTVKKQ